MVKVELRSSLFSLKQLSKKIGTKDVSPVDLVGICLDRIKKLDPKLNAFITVIEEEELYKQAQTVEEEIRCNSDRHKQSK
jgi:aspartyl-tRNA(Asn)/glutamyl-tRNA(Gln) amidotransferase subunit A